MAVIDELIIIENGESKIVDSADNKTIDVINGSYLNNVDYHFAKENEVLNGICENAVNEPIRDMQISGNSVQNGTPTPETPIKIESVGERTKNLINKDASEENYFINSSGEKKPATYGLTVTDKIYVKPSTNYTFSGMGNVGQTTVMRSGYQYDNNDNPIKKIETAYGNPITFTTEANCSYIYLQYVKAEETPMLEESDVETEYEPYGYKVPIKISNGLETTTTNIYLNEPLRKIGDYADYINYKNKKVVRNIAREFITNVEYISSNSGAYKTFLSDISHKPLISYGDYNNPPYSMGFAISNKFKQSSYQYRLLGNYPNLIQSYITSGGINRLAYTFGDSSITTIELAQEVIGDGFEVCYVLATPTEETIEIPAIETFDGTTTIRVETTVEPSEFTINYWKQIGVVEPEILPDEITQDSSSILIISTGATITQDGSSITIGE